MCATCPFRTGSKYSQLQDHLSLSALNEASRICHSTGINAIGGRTRKKPLICRGARDLQLKVMAALGVIAEPTDEAWAAAWENMNSAKAVNQSL